MKLKAKDVTVTLGFNGDCTTTKFDELREEYGYSEIKPGHLSEAQDKTFRLHTPQAEPIAFAMADVDEMLEREERLCNREIQDEIQRDRAAKKEAL